jgi:hypothetical protein
MKLVGTIISLLSYVYMVNMLGFVKGFFLWLGLLFCIGIVVSITRKIMGK